MYLSTWKGHAGERAAATWTPWFYETLASDELKTAALEAFDPFGADQTLSSARASRRRSRPLPCRAATSRLSTSTRVSARCDCIARRVRARPAVGGRRGRHNYQTPVCAPQAVGNTCSSSRCCAARDAARLEPALHGVPVREQVAVRVRRPLSDLRDRAAQVPSRAPRRASSSRASCAAAAAAVAAATPRRRRELWQTARARGARW